MLILVLLLIFVFVDDLNAFSRVARQGPPSADGGPPAGINGGGNMAIAANYNYSISTVIATADPLITSWVKSTGISSIYKVYTNVNKIQYSSQYVYVSASGIPSYTIGPWPSNPNVASNQNYTFQFPRVPMVNTGNKISTSLGNIAILTNGIGVFNANDAMNIMGWSRNAFFFEGSTFDSCRGHPQQSGVYHVHIMPNCLFNATDSTKHSPLIGYSFDGFPIYGPFGYSNSSSSSSSIKRMLSSYNLRNITSRTTLADGTPQTGPTINSTYPMGAFIDDFQYVVGYGDLDSYNGRFTVTPEYPSGTYAYFFSTDNSSVSTYPYTLGKQYYGIVVSADVTGKVSPTESVMTYYSATSASNVVKSHHYLLLFIFCVKFL